MVSWTEDNLRQIYMVKMDDTKFIYIDETPDEETKVINPENKEEITEKQDECRQFENGTDVPKKDDSRKLPTKKIRFKDAVKSVYIPRKPFGNLRNEGDEDENIQPNFNPTESPSEQKQYSSSKKKKDSSTLNSYKKIRLLPYLTFTPSKRKLGNVNLPTFTGSYKNKGQGHCEAEVLDDENGQYLPSLNPDFVAQDLVAAIEENNLGRVEIILLDHPDLNLYLHVDAKGVSAVERAVETENPFLVETLIEKSPFPEEINDLIKHALNVSIKRDDINMVRHLLDMKRLNSPNPASADASIWKPDFLNNTIAQSKGYHSRFQDATFSVSISPMILAAQLKRQEIITILLFYGESDIHPVTKSCGMPDCIMNSCNRVPAGLITIEQSHTMLQTYSAISSPAFILNSGVHDPLYEAFSICAEMEQLQYDDPAFREEYKSIEKKCKRFTMDLVNLCRSTEEMDVLLQCEHSPQGEPKIPCFRQIHHSRLQMALSYKQTAFVTHPHVQKFLQKAWYDGCPNFVLRTQNSRLRFLYLLLFLLLYPILCPTYMLQCCPYVNTLLKTAVLKFVVHSTSYILFLVVLISAAVHDLEMVSLNETSTYHWTHFALIASWIIGFTLRHLNSAPHERCFSTNKSGFQFKEVFGASRFYDFILILFFIFAMLLHFIVLLGNDKDLAPVAASFYALGALGAIFRICKLMKESSSLGPLYISFRSMLFDILKFAVLILVILTAFVVAHLNLIRFDDKNRAAQSEVITNGTQPGGRMFINGSNMTLADTPPLNSSFQDGRGETTGLRMLLMSRTICLYRGYFWALLGYGEIKQGRVNFEGHVNETIGLLDVGTLSAGEEFQMLVSKILLYSYLIVVTIALLNMLIAMMATTFSKIERNCDIEWKFARSCLRMSYFNSYGVLPPPLNIIPVPYIIKALKCAIKGKPLHPISRSSCKVNKDFTELMENLSKRYWSQENSSNADQAEGRQGSEKRRGSSGTIYSIFTNM